MLMPALKRQQFRRLVVNANLAGLPIKGVRSATGVSASPVHQVVNAEDPVKT
jgi:hypothetical protein